MKRVLSLLCSCLAAAVQAAPPVSGTWSGELLGHKAVVVLEERAGGGITGFMATDPNARIVSGLNDGGEVLLHIAVADPGLAAAGTFDGVIAGNTLNGTFTLGGIPAPATLERENRRYSVEYWLMGEDDIQSHALRLLDKKGDFVGGGYAGIDHCDFLSCAGDFTVWDVDGDAHTLTADAGGSCFLNANLGGVWNDSEKLLVGTYAGTDCNGALSGDFIAGKGGLTGSKALERVLGLLAGFADRVQAESLAALDHIADGYLNDGKTKAHWESDLAELYGDYNNLSVQIARVDEVVTANDVDVNPMIVLPPRVGWRLVVTGEPEGGGAVETVADEVFTLQGNQQLYMIGAEKGGYVFTGNGYAESFAIDLPIGSLADSDNAAYGLWPFGVHGGGHPEGHQGWDVEYAAGAQVRAAAGGVVTGIAPNDDFPGQFNITIEHRPGISTRYDHVTNPAVAVDAPVSAGAVLGDPGSFAPGFFAVHFALVHLTGSVCPSDSLSPAAQTLFDSIWLNAAYNEELVEPFPCQALAADFPLSRLWQRSAGALAPRIVFSRAAPGSTNYGYELRDAADVVIETGTAVVDTATTPASIDLDPAGAGATRLGVYRVVSEEMLIDWDDAVRPADLGGATTYSTE